MFGINKLLEILCEDGMLKIHGGADQLMNRASDMARYLARSWSGSSSNTPANNGCLMIRGLSARSQNKCSSFGLYGELL
jgi:hypothetical protein